MSIKTHYENLKVARDAPSDVIRAAYKALTQKYNSDRNPNADAKKQLEIINNSNSVLSNPVKRAEYDQWLVEQESAITSKRQVKKIESHFDDGKEIIIGKESDISAYKNEKKLYRWLIYAAVGLAAIIAITWFISTGNDIDNNNESVQISSPEIVKNLSNQTATAQAAQTEQEQYKPEILINKIPAHDKVAINKFNGLWESSNYAETGQTLDISLKSDQSIIFRLDAKARQGIGGVYGIAEFQNNYALFFNEEYGCTILFTIKSNVLQITTSSCQEYHGSGIPFDGTYIKPGSMRTITKPSATKTNSAVAPINTDNAIQPKPAQISPVVVKNTPKLYKFSAKVKDAEGNISEIELIAKDKDAARAIIRDFRGNPEILKIKQLKK